MIALVIGMVSGYAEGTIVDDVLSFFTNVALVIPVLPLIIMLVAYSEVRGIGLIVGVIAITSWAGAARSKRAQIITLRNRDFVTAAKFSGEGPLRIVFWEIMPNMTSLVAAAFVGAATGAIGAEAGLAVLGLGSSDSVSWGTILYQADAAGAASQGLFAWVFVPGLVLARPDHRHVVHQLRRRPAEQPAPERRADMALLEVQDLQIRYEPKRHAAVDAVSDVTFSDRAGRVRRPDRGVRLGQDHAGHGAAAAAGAARAGSPAARSSSTASTSPT